VLPNIANPYDPAVRTGYPGHPPARIRIFVGGRRKSIPSTRSANKSSLSLNLGYTWYWGGGDQNVLSDRDFAQAFVSTVLTRGRSAGGLQKAIARGGAFFLDDGWTGD